MTGADVPLAVLPSCGPSNRGTIPVLVLSRAGSGGFPLMQERLGPVRLPAVLLSLARLAALLKTWQNRPAAAPRRRRVRVETHPPFVQVSAVGPSAIRSTSTSAPFEHGDRLFAFQVLQCLIEPRDRTASMIETADQTPYLSGTERNVARRQLFEKLKEPKHVDSAVIRRLAQYIRCRRGRW